MAYLDTTTEEDEELKLLAHLAHEAAEGRYEFDGYELSNINEALNELIDIRAKLKLMLSNDYQGRI